MKEHPYRGYPPAYNISGSIERASIGVTSESLSPNIIFGIYPVHFDPSPLTTHKAQLQTQGRNSPSRELYALPSLRPSILIHGSVNITATTRCTQPSMPTPDVSHVQLSNVHAMVSAAKSTRNISVVVWTIFSHSIVSCALSLRSSCTA